MPPGSVDLSSGWKLTFADSSQPLALEHLHSWTEEANHRYFSGLATYQRTVTLDRAQLKSQRQYLNFGEGTPVTVEERRSGNGMRAMLEAFLREAAVVP